MDDTTIIIIIISCCVMSIISSLIGTGIYATNLPKEGDKCEGDDMNADYEIDSDGECAFVDCRVGYEYDGVACAVSSKTGEDDTMTEEIVEKDVGGDRESAQEVVGIIRATPPVEKQWAARGGIEQNIEDIRGEFTDVARPAVIIPGMNVQKPVIVNPMLKHYGVPSSLTDEQAQCYLNRYSDLQDSYGLTNIEAAKKHWITHGVHENRNYKCESGSNVEMAKTPEFGSVEMILKTARQFENNFDF